MFAEKNRKRFGRLVTIERLVEFLQSGSDSTTKKWAARALGNLAYDNGAYNYFVDCLFQPHSSLVS